MKRIIIVQAVSEVIAMLKTELETLKIVNSEKYSVTIDIAILITSPTSTIELLVCVIIDIAILQQLKIQCVRLLISPYENWTNLNNCSVSVCDY